jgi:hypothetical protein
MTGPTPRSGPPSENFFRLDKRLQSLETKIVILGVPDQNGRRPYWDLWGAHSGAQGITLAPQLVGLMHTPFQQLISEGPYQVGATYERVDYRKREIQFQVHVGIGEPDTIFRYRMVEQRWWSSWSPKEDSYLGVFTRTHGWRWLRVRLAEDPKTVMMLDPQAMDNNYMGWDMKIIAAQPYWCKRQEVATWANDGEGDGGIPATPWDELEEFIEDILEGLIPGVSALIPGAHIGEGNIVVPNRGDQPAFPKFLVSSPGRAWIEDGPGGKMVELPLLTPQDGTVLVDTDPTARTITSATDPVDPLFYRIARNSQLLEFFLHDITSGGLPVWRRFYGRFSTPWPAKTVCRIKVRHSNAGGSITALMPQKYGSAYA